MRRATREESIRVIEVMLKLRLRKRRLTMSDEWIKRTAENVFNETEHDPIMVLESKEDKELQS